MCEPEFLAWLTDPKLDGAGALFDFGCYGADLMTWLMDGRRPTAVTAVVQQIKPDIYPKVDDEATVILTYPQAQAIIQASWNWPFDRKDMEVYGQTGYAITVARDQVRVRRAGGEEEKITAPPIPPPDDDPINYLRAVVLGGLKPQGLSSLETNVVVMEILDAARQSAASGKTIQLAPKKGGLRSGGVLVPVQQLVMRGVGRIAELRVLAGGTLGADRLQIDGREDGVLGLGAAGSSFLEQRNRGLAAARAMKDVDVQVRHGGSPVVVTSIGLAPTVRANQAVGATPSRVSCLFPDAKRAEDEIQDVVGGSGAGDFVERTQCAVEIEQDHFMWRLQRHRGRCDVEGEE